MNIRYFTGAALLLGAMAAAPAAAIDVSLGASSEIFTLYGLGETSPGSGLGTFNVGQGSSVYDPITNTSTFTLSGAITGGSVGFTTGTYSFVTTYEGLNLPNAGPNAPLARSNPGNLLFFFYSGLDSSTFMTLNLSTESGNYIQPLVAAGSFVPNTGFSFLRTTSACTGVASCTQNNVGITPGATIFGPVTISANFAQAVGGVPEPSTWMLMIVGVAVTGYRMRRRRSDFAVA